MQGAPVTVKEKFFEDRDEEDYNYPPVIFMLDLEGGLLWFNFYLTILEDQLPMLNDPVPIPVGKPINTIPVTKKEPIKAPLEPSPPKLD